MNPRKIYLIGICGTAMGALAAMLKESGHRVVGSDLNIYPPISTFLEEKGILILPGYASENIDAEKPDLVVVGNVVRRDNPEAVRTMELGLDYRSLPQTLGELFLEGRQSVVAAGTHGKTTTSALMAWLLTSAGLDPSMMVGGICKNFDNGTNYHLGGGDHFVLEGDEYDTAFFDKEAKFLHYRPKYAVLTGIEFDHADIFKDLAAIEAQFAKFIGLIPADGCLAVYGRNQTAVNLAQKAACRVLSYGFDDRHDVRADGISLGPDRVTFDLVYQGRDLGRMESPLPGLHNLANTLGCLALLLSMGLDRDRLARGLAGFAGVKRRQEIIARIRRADGDILVMDDFAHHPTAVRETLDALKAFYPDRRLVAAFEPRSATSARNIFQADYARAFDSANLVLVKEAFKKPDVAEQDRFSSARLATDLTERGLKAGFFTRTEDLLAELIAGTEVGDLIVIMSNGGFDGLHRDLVRALSD